MRQLVRRLGLIGVLIVLAGMAVAQPAAAADLPPGAGPVRIFVGDNPHKCLEGDLNHIHENNDTVQLWDCWVDPGNQHWFVAPIDDVGRFKVINQLGNTCLENAPGQVTNGARIELSTCAAGDTNQVWVIYDDQSGLGYKFMGESSGLMLDADLGHINVNGDKIQLWNYWQDPGNAHWHYNGGIVPVG